MSHTQHPSHKMRFSDSSIDDERCEYCGAGDSGTTQYDPCPDAPNVAEDAAKREEEAASARVVDLRKRAPDIAHRLAFAAQANPGLSEHLINLLLDASDLITAGTSIKERIIAPLTIDTKPLLEEIEKMKKGFSLWFDIQEAKTHQLKLEAIHKAARKLFNKDHALEDDAPDYDLLDINTREYWCNKVRATLPVVNLDAAQE